MATKVYDVEEIELQNGDVLKLKPLTIDKLRLFMREIQKTSEAITEEDTMNILLEACAIAISNQLPELVADRAKLEAALDMPTVSKILEVCGGIKLDDPNLLAAAVLAGQNSI